MQRLAFQNDAIKFSAQASEKREALTRVVERMVVLKGGKVEKSGSEQKLEIKVEPPSRERTEQVEPTTPEPGKRAPPGRG